MTTVNKIKIELQDKLTEATQSMFMSQPGKKEAYYYGKAAAFAEAIELIKEMEKKK